MQLPDTGDYRRALQTAVRNNTSAFGFSVVITGTLAAVSSFSGAPDGLDILLFGAGAVASFSLVDAIASGGFRRSLTSEPPEVIAHAASVSFASVGLGLGTGIGLADLIGGDLVWVVAAFAASVVFLLCAALEMAVARRVEDPES